MCFQLYAIIFSSILVFEKQKKMSLNWPCVLFIKFSLLLHSLPPPCSTLVCAYLLTQYYIVSTLVRDLVCSLVCGFFRVLFFKVADTFYLLVVEEWSASSRAKPGEGEERGQPGVSEERPAAVHLPAVWKREAGTVACHSHNAAAQSRGEKQTGCHCTRYVQGTQVLWNWNLLFCSHYRACEVHPNIVKNVYYIVNKLKYTQKC